MSAIGLLLSAAVIIALSPPHQTARIVGIVLAAIAFVLALGVIPGWR